MGTQQMMSVPYALYAEKAGNAGDDQDQDPTNELQTLSLSGDTLSLSNGGEVVLDSGTESSIRMMVFKCVDMGVSVGGLDWTECKSWSQREWLSIFDDQLSTRRHFNAPHWRQFQIFGLPEGVQR